MHTCKYSECNTQIPGHREFCSPQHQRMYRKAFHWSASKRQGGAKPANKVRGREFVDEFDWSWEEDGRYFAYLGECHKTRTTPMTEPQWRQETRNVTSNEDQSFVHSAL